MANMTRRNFLQTLAAGAGTSLAGFPLLSFGAGKRVVVIGGGTGGATVAKYLRRADSSIQVTLIEKNPQYITCYMSNEVLGGGRTIDSLTFDYSGLRAYGVNVVQDEVTGIDAQSKTVYTASGTTYVYDRCVVSPGIDFRYDEIAGYDAQVAETIPHAWKAGAQTLTLRAQLEAMNDGGTVVIAAPPNPYRCPPAPYERASQIAHYLKQHKPASKVIILDGKTSFAKQALFEQAWTSLYGYGSDNALLEWWSGSSSAAQVVAVDAATTTVTTEFGDMVQANVLNVIPPQKAGALAFTAGLTDGTGWCPVNKQTFESAIIPDIHVIGDACIADALPKSGFAANSEAKVCAAAIAALLNDQEVPNPAFSNGCYSVVGEDYAISILGIYRLSDDGKTIAGVPGSGGPSSTGATDFERKVDVQYAYGWYDNFTRDVFR
ncbi:MAG: NAD(P)/FAD-dependent oxidoreductase [Thiolinea sp.]